MLNDYERQSLGELESQLAADDPEFVASFRADGQRLRRRSPLWPYTTVIVFAGLLAVLSIALLQPVAAFLAATLAAGCWWVRQARRPHHVEAE